VSDPRPQLLAMGERGYGDPAVRDHATLMLRIADRRFAERAARTSCANRVAWRQRCEAARDLGWCLLIAAVCLWLGWALGGGR
jgi:hypothetical protein